MYTLYLYARRTIFHVFTNPTAGYVSDSHLQDYDIAYTIPLASTNKNKSFLFISEHYLIVHHVTDIHSACPTVLVL